MENNKYLLTGVPRSGSTLFLNLLSHNKNALCLDEPKWLKTLRSDQQKTEMIPQDIDVEITHIREDIINGTPVNVVHQVGTGSIPTNHFDRLPNGDIVKTKTTKKVVIVPQVANGPIIIKSNIFFTSILESLINSRKFKILVTIRDPIATIKSWRSLNFSLSQGRSLIAEKYSTKVKEFNREEDLLIRQIMLLDWMIKTYYDNKAKIKVFKYEEFIKNPESLKGLFNNWNGEIKSKFKSRNNNSVYDHTEDSDIIRAIREHSHFIKYYYPYIFE